MISSRVKPFLMATKLQYGRLELRLERFSAHNCDMQGIYEFSSSDRVKRFEEDLSKELKELQNAIEENDFLKVTRSNGQKSFRYVQ